MFVILLIPLTIIFLVCMYIDDFFMIITFGTMLELTIVVLFTFDNLKRIEKLESIIKDKEDEI